MLVDVNVACIRFLMDSLGLERKLVLASSLQVETDDPTLRLVKICQALGGDAYLSGKDGAKYMDLEQINALYTKLLESYCRDGNSRVRFLLDEQKKRLNG